MARIVLVVQPGPVGISLTWSDGPAAFPPYDLPTKPLAAASAAARDALGAVVGNFLSGDATELPAVSGALADAGYALYQALFKPPAEQMSRATEVRKWLDKLHTGAAVESLEVVADGVDAVPWNLVYDRRPDAAAFRAGGDDPARWLPFWGIRYDLSCGRRVSPLRRFPVLNNPRVVVVTDPFVIDNLPDEARGLAELCQSQGWPLARSRADLAAALGGGRPDLLYWLGHTQTDPFGLVLGEDVITPDDLRALLESDPFAEAGEVFGGVAFLNACGTAQAAPSGSFQDALHPLGLSGLIATEQTTIDTFAAPLGREFLRAFAVGGEELGAVMRAMRGRVPLGLIYGSYCPPVLRVRRTAEPAGQKAAGVVFTRITSGTKLGLPGLAARTDRPLPAHPYRSLRAYGFEDRALFAGRDDDVLRFARALDDPATRVLILHGESGVGKTSFLRAGVIPFLETECAGFRFARDRSKPDADPVLMIRATNDAVSQIASAVAAYCARPLTYRTPAGDEAVADLPGALGAALGLEPGVEAPPGAVLSALRAELRADPGLLGRVLAEVARALPFAPVLVLDQAEEVFTLARTPEDETNRVLALEMIRRAAGTPGGFKLVVSLRTEYHGRFADRLRKGAGAAGVREYLLTDFGFDALVEVIRRPTAAARIPHASEVPFERYKFRYADGVAEQIARSAQGYALNRQDSVLPLVQVLCLQLYDRVRARGDGSVTAADLEAIGGVQGGMKRFAEDMVQRLFPRRADQAAFRHLLAGPDVQLFIQQPDGTMTTALLPAAFLAEHWGGSMPFDQMLGVAAEGDWRLLRVNSLRIGDDVERPYVSLGHDALAHVAARWAEERKRRAQVRKFGAAVVVLLAVAGGLFALSAWALDKQKQAQINADKAIESEKKALESEKEALASAGAAQAARKVAEGEQARAETAQKAAEAERGKAEAARAQVLLTNREATTDALEVVKASGRLGIPERAFLEKNRERWKNLADPAKHDPGLVAEASFRVALLLAASDQADEALKWYNLTCARAAALCKPPDEPDYKPDYPYLLARAKLNKGLLLGGRKEWDTAQAEYEQAAAILDGLIERPAPTPAEGQAYRSIRALLHNSAAARFQIAWLATPASAPADAQTHFDLARREFERACEVCEGLVREVPRDPGYKALLAIYHKNLGLLWLQRLTRSAPDDPERAATICESQHHLVRALTFRSELVAEHEVKPEDEREQVKSGDKREQVNLDYKLEQLNAYNDLGVLLSLSPATTDWAREHFDDAQKVGTWLIEQHPTHPGYRVALARSLCNLGATLPVTDHAERLQRFNAALVALGVGENTPSDDNTKRVLRDALRGRARALEERARAMSRHSPRDAEAEAGKAYADWERVIKLSAGDEKLASRCESLIALNGFSSARAVAEVDKLQRVPLAPWDTERWGAAQWYLFAKVHGGSASKANTGNERQQRIDLALAHLEKAVELGWADAEELDRDASNGPFVLLQKERRFDELLKRLPKKKAP